MIRLLQLLIFGHAHKWAIIRKVDIVRHDATPVAPGLPLHRDYECQCETCGKIRKFRC